MAASSDMLERGKSAIPRVLASSCVIVWAKESSSDTRAESKDGWVPRNTSNCSYKQQRNQATQTLSGDCRAELSSLFRKYIVPKWVVDMEREITLKGVLPMSLAWNLERRGGSRGLPVYRGIGRPKAMTLKSSLTRTIFHFWSSSTEWV